VRIPGWEKGADVALVPNHNAAGDNPNPVPRPHLFGSKNGSKMRDASSGGMPSPLSAISTSTHASGRCRPNLPGINGVSIRLVTLVLAASRRPDARQTLVVFPATMSPFQPIAKDDEGIFSPSCTSTPQALRTVHEEFFD